MQRLGFSWWWLLLATAMFWVYFLAGLRWLSLFFTLAFLSDETFARESWAVASGYVGIGIAAITLVSFGVTALNLLVNLFGFAGLNHKYLALGTWISSLLFPLIDSSSLYLCLVTGLISSIVFGLLREVRYKRRIKRPKRERVTGYICRSCQTRGTRKSSRCSVCNSSNLTLITTAWGRSHVAVRPSRPINRQRFRVVLPLAIHSLASGLLVVLSLANENIGVPLLTSIFGLVVSLD